MPDITPDDIRERIEALAGVVVGNVLTGLEERIARETLPAVEARYVSDSEQANGARGGLVASEWQLWLFVREIVKPESYAETVAGLKACYPYLFPMRDYFRIRPQLQDANLLNPLVQGTTRMVGVGPTTTPYKDTKTYSCIRWTFNVTVSCISTP